MSSCKLAAAAALLIAVAALLALGVAPANADIVAPNAPHITSVSSDGVRSVSYGAVPDASTVYSSTATVSTAGPHWIGSVCGSNALSTSVSVRAGNSAGWSSWTSLDQFGNPLGYRHAQQHAFEMNSLPSGREGSHTKDRVCL